MVPRRGVIVPRLGKLVSAADEVSVREIIRGSITMILGLRTIMPGLTKFMPGLMTFMPGLTKFMPGIGKVFHGVTEAPCAGIDAATVVAAMAAITAATIVL
jgi:hypothetical protein